MAIPFASLSQGRGLPAIWCDSPYSATSEKRVDPHFVEIGIIEACCSDVERHALALLQRELGLDGLARFLRLYRAGTGDYTGDRHLWLEGTTVDEIMAAVSRPGNPPERT